MPRSSSSDLCTDLPHDRRGQLDTMIVNDENARRRKRGFRALIPDPAWAALVQHGVRRQHHAGERLLQQQDAGGWVLLCLAGRMKVVYAQPDGREVLLAVRGPGDVLGEFSGGDGGPRSATVQAVEPGVTSKVFDQRFSGLVADLDLSAQLNTYILGKMRESAPHAWQLAHRTTAARLIGLIGALIDVAGPDHPHPDTIPMSQEELASALGLVRSAITPVLAGWRAAGLIRTSRGSLQVPDFPALRSSVE